jgi:hypothetical protein
VLTAGFAWLRPPAVLGQAVGIVVLISNVSAAFLFVATEPESWRKISLRGAWTVAVLSIVSISLSVGLCIVYFIAKSIFLIALALLVFLSRKFNREGSGST